MTTFVILLRAVNVGGTGKLPMADLRAIAATAGLQDVRTYIASGNLVANSEKSEAVVKSAMEKALHAYAGARVGVVVRTAAELAEALANNPFKTHPPNFTVAIFLDSAPAPDALDNVKGRADEQLALGRREIYVAYGAGLGRSKLKIPAATAGTARNINTVVKLVEMTGGG